MFFFLNGCAYKDDDYLFKVNHFVFTESDFFSRPDFLLAHEAGLKKNDVGYEDLIQDVFLETLSARISKPFRQENFALLIIDQFFQNQPK